MKLDINSSLKILVLATGLYCNGAYAALEVTSLESLNPSRLDTQSQASDPSESTALFVDKMTIDEVQLRDLAEHPQWQHLLFFKNGKAEVISEDFYLSDPMAELATNFDPYVELIQTLNHKDDQQVMCQYPARYFWLKHHIPSLNIDLTVCPTLPDPDQSISLILVSDYLKNPASSFGHVLLKTNKSETENFSQSTVLSSEDLLNSAYNFGARIPQDENGVMYAMKGLFGFYDAGFAEAEFFKQDAVYSKNEQRDMWEYVLNLNPFQTRLLNYHLYEAKSARFDYYFIKQNCGYCSGELLELISDIKTTERLGPWYAPDYVFNQLVEYDADNEQPLIASVRYLPSEQTQLRQKFVQLPKSLQRKINQVITTSDQAPGSRLQVLNSLQDEQKALALDFLILHQTYKISQKDTPEKQSFKRQLVSERFNLPASNALAQLVVPHKPSPALSNKTTKTQVMLSDQAAQLGLSLFVKDPLNRHTDINKRFEAVKTTVDYNFEDKKWLLSEFTFIDMQQIENLAQPLAGEPKLSWQLKTGARIDPFNGNSHRPFLQGGLGGGVALKDNVLGYSMINMMVHDQHQNIDAGFEAGIRAKRGGQAAEIAYQHIKREGADAVSNVKFTLRQQLAKNDDVRLWISHNDNNNLKSDEGVEAGITWHHYW